jgi:protein-S-isoprenylcysteine O-methyltransferase Ste14
VALQWTGLACVAAVFGVWYWAMRVNSFFSTAVRIQAEREHRVVTRGPYRLVRHPGYASLVLLGWGGPVALGSWWAVLPHVVVVAVFVRRARLEDRMLQEELPGYGDYAQVVRYRLLPGVW